MRRVLQWQTTLPHETYKRRRPNHLAPTLWIVAGVVAYGINVTVKEDIVKALAAQEGITLNEDDLDKVANSMSAAAASLGVHMVFV